MGTARRGSIRAGAVVLAAALGVLAPGVNPLAAPTASAQDDARPPWAPPAPRGGPPKDTGKPDKEYLPRIDCVRSSTDGHETVSNTVLPNKPWGQMHLRIDEVHRYVTSKSPSGKIGVDADGDPIEVAVIDTGVTAHNFLPPDRLTGGGDYVAGGDGLEDCDGHGTQVAGIIAAKHDDPRIGFIGVAPDAHIVSIRQSSQNFSEKTEEEAQREKEEAQREKEAAEAKRRADEAERRAEQDRKRMQDEIRRLEERGGGDSPGGTGPSQDEDGGSDRSQNTAGGAGTRYTLAQAVVNAVDRGVAVINMSVDACRPNFSVGGEGIQLAGDEKDLQSAVRYAVDNDVVVVAAAGNVGGNCQQNGLPDRERGAAPDPNNPTTIVTPPWFAEDLLAVAAIDKDGGVADFSMRGPWVSVAAPGTDITSLDPAKNSNGLVNIMFEGEQAVQIRGTSFAAPYVAGLAVLVKQIHPDLNARQVMDRIKATAQHPGAPGGRDHFIGYGVIDPMAALTATLPEEIGMERAVDVSFPSDMPPPSPPNDTAIIVALAGSGGALAALGMTLFIVHTMRRRSA